MSQLSTLPWLDPKTSPPPQDRLLLLKVSHLEGGMEYRLARWSGQSYWDYEDEFFRIPHAQVYAYMIIE